MPQAPLPTPKHCGAVSRKPRPGYGQELRLLPGATHGVRLPGDVVDVQQLVAEELLEGDLLLPVSQQDLGEIGKATTPVAAQQQFLILSEPGAFVVAPSAKPLDASHPQRMP